MPTYDYECDACGHEFEMFQNISEEPKKKCPACKKQKLRRLFGAGAAVVFKGSGFYQTDYRSESYKKAAAAEKSSSSDSSSNKSESSSGGKSEGQSESKAETKSEPKSESKSSDSPKSKKPPKSEK